MSEIERRTAAAGSNVEGARLESEVAEIEARRRRLVRLFTAAICPGPLLHEESQALASQRARLESRRIALAAAATPTWNIEEIKKRLPSYIAAVGDWIASAEGNDLDLLLRAVDARITASRTEAEISGSIPMIESQDYADLVTTEQTSA